jgi:hypothetical protein
MTVSGISAAEMPGSATTMWISHLVSDTNDGGSELKMSNNLRGTQTHTEKEIIHMYRTASNK